jgi:hypothetical protein
MRYCDQHPEEIDKLAKVKAQVTEVKGVMMQNIEKVCLILLLHCSPEESSLYLVLKWLYIYWSSGARSW